MAEKDEGLSPLDFMLSVMRDPNATRAERIEMAKAAAPYFHGRATSSGSGAGAVKPKPEPEPEPPPLVRIIERRVVDPEGGED
jgi:hypothetical protein